MQKTRARPRFLFSCILTITEEATSYNQSHSGALPCALLAVLRCSQLKLRIN